MFLSEEDLKELVNYRDRRGAASLYIFSSPSEQWKDFRARLNSFVQLLSREAGQEKNRDLSRIIRKFPRLQEELENYFPENKTKTFCIFAAPDFFRYLEVPLRLRERIVVENNFYTQPLLNALPQFYRYAVLLFDRQKARVFNYFLGRLREEDAVFHNYVLPTFNASAGEWHAYNEKTLAHKIQETFNRHLREIAERLFRNFGRFGFQKLILASHHNELKSIRPHLHSYLLEKTCGEFTADMDESLKQIEAKTAKVAQEHRRQLERRKLEELYHGHAHKRAVLGVQLVDDALMGGNVRELIMHNDFHTEGYVCPVRHFLSVNPPADHKCIYCGRRLERRNYFEDEIAEDAFLKGSRLFNIVEEKENFNDYRIGALLRY